MGVGVEAVSGSWLSLSVCMYTVASDCMLAVGIRASVKGM